MIRKLSYQAERTRTRQIVLVKENNRISGEELLDKHYFHEAERMNQRTDWFLIFHAILMEAFFSIKKPDTASIVVVGSLGLLLSCLWLLSGLRTGRMAWHLGGMIRKEMGSNASEMHSKIFSEREKTVNANQWWGWTRFLPLFGVLIPAIFVIAWIALILIKIPGCHIASLLYLLGGCILALCISAITLIKIVEPIINKPRR